MTIQSPLWWRKWRARRWVFETDRRELFDPNKKLRATSEIQSEARRRFHLPEGMEL